MKPALLALAASAASVSAVKFVNGPTGWSSSVGFQTDKIDERQWDQRAKLAKREENAGPLAAKRQEMKNRNPHIPGAKTVKIRYGPYSVPGAKVPGGEGMLENRPSPSVEKPCQNCMLLGMNAGLEYPDGTDANTDTLLWLHHMVMFNIGKGAGDATCPVFGAPHLIVGSMSSSSERFFSSGNERTTTFFNPPWANVTNLGYPIYPTDRFGMIMDLMNMNNEAKSVYTTVYFDYIEGHPANFDEVKPVWLDAAQCGTSEISGRTPGAKFDFASRPWVANFEGEVLGTGGHLHDGGMKVDIVVDGKVVCRSVPTYGTDAQAKARAEISKLGALAPPGMSAGVKINSKRQTKPTAPKTPAAPMAPMAPMAGMAKDHIIAMSICADNVVGVKDIPISPLSIHQLVKGQSWVLKAYYDYAAHPGMKKQGGNTQTTVMGISIMYVKTKTKRPAPA